MLNIQDFLINLFIIDKNMEGSFLVEENIQILLGKVQP